LGYTTAIDYRPENYAAAHRRGYEDWLTGSETMETSKAYLAGYRQAQRDDVDYGRGQEEIYWGNRDPDPGCWKANALEYNY
jgi:ribosome modulation factor